MKKSVENIQYDFFNNKVLELVILPTELCNFKCIYCYEPDYGSNMSPVILNSILSLIKRRHVALSLLRIGWFGGEPLLRYKDIIKWTRGVKDILGDSFQHKYISHMSTNGYLLDVEKAKELVKLNTMVFQITLDGTSEWHNKTRMLRDGNDSFDSIWKNLISLHASKLEFRINMRIHLHKKNIESANDLIIKINSSFAGDDRFRVYFRPLSNLGSPKGEVDDLYLNKQEAKIIIDTLRVSRGLLIPEVLSDCDEYICYAARPNCFVMRPDGKVVKCTIGLDDPENYIGNINEQGSLLINQDRIREWLHGAITKDKKAMRCPRSYVCNNQIISS